MDATASASGTGFSGPVDTGVSNKARSTEHLPIVIINKTGPTQLTAGAPESNPLALRNSGGAVATAITVTDSLPNRATGTVTGVPASLASGASGTAQARYVLPASQPAGNLTDTASLVWQDANGNSYGPVSSSFTTTVLNSLLSARLTLTPANAGPDVTGTSQKLTATLLDRNGKPIANQPVSFAVTGANPTNGSGTTDSGGNATFTYRGANKGTDQVQATV